MKERAHNWRCKCLPCRVQRAAHYKRWREGQRLMVSAKEARQLLLTFEDAKDAARVLKMPHNTIWRIRKGEVKMIRQATAKRIYEGLAA